MSVNKAILIGNVGRDPEIRYMAENKPIASFSLATTERAYTTAAGVNVPEKTEWHNIVMWGKNAEFAAGYAPKSRISCILALTIYGANGYFSV